MKKFKLSIILAIISLLVACNQEGDSLSIINTNSDQAITEEIGLPEPIQNVAMQAAYDYILNAQTAAYHVQGEFISPLGSIKKDQYSQEKYEEGLLKEYYIEIENTVNDELSREKFYYDGEKYYLKHHHQNWQETDYMTRSQMLMYNLGKILLETDQFDISLSSDNQKYLISFSNISEENKTSLTSYLDFPLILSPSANLEGNYEYVLSRDSGQILQANYDIKIEDLGENYQITFAAQAEDPDTEISVDLNESSDMADNTDFLSKFIESNIIDGLVSYEMIESDYLSGEETIKFHFVNLLNNHPHFIIESLLISEEIQASQVLFQNQSYKVEGDQVLEEASSMTDYLGQFLTYFIDNYSQDNFFVIEADEDNPVTIYRQIFESGYEEFNEQVGFIDLSPIEQDEYANYAIEYFVDPESAQLLSLNLWAITANETEINNMIQLMFNNINKFNPNYVRDNIPQAVWERIQ